MMPARYSPVPVPLYTAAVSSVYSSTAVEQFLILYLEVSDRATAALESGRAVAGPHVWVKGESWGPFLDCKNCIFKFQAVKRNTDGLGVRFF